MTPLPEPLSFAMRPANMHDLEELTAIDALCFPAGIAYPRGEIAWLLRNPRITTVIAELAGAVGGFAACQRKQQQNVRYGELITIEVLPQFRRQSIGRELYQVLEKNLRDWGGTRMQLQVSVENAVAVSFYQRLGYRTVSRIPRYYLQTIDAWQMEKVFPGKPA
ncbi:MAG: N-acetyltransferase [Acidobacteriaceae bacterium]